MKDLDFIAVMIPILFILGALVLCIIQAVHANNSTNAEPQKTVKTETLIPSHVAKCTETIGHVCTTYTIYRVTTP